MIRKNNTTYYRVRSIDDIIKLETMLTGRRNGSIYITDRLYYNSGAYMDSMRQDAADRNITLKPCSSYDGVIMIPATEVCFNEKIGGKYIG